MYIACLKKKKNLKKHFLRNANWEIATERNFNTDLETLFSELLGIFSLPGKQQTLTIVTL